MPKQKNLFGEEEPLPQVATQKAPKRPQKREDPLIGRDYYLEELIKQRIIKFVLSGHH